MLIAAAHKFGCSHRFVVTKETHLFSLICEVCEHRVEELPLVLPRSAGTAPVIPFPTTSQVTVTSDVRTPRRASKSSQLA